MRKIDPTSVIKKLESLKFKKFKQKKFKLPEQKPDTFEYVNKAKNYADEMSTMTFVRKEIKFYPEDIEKMEKMSHEEKMEYLKKLKQEKRYIEVPEDQS